MTTNAVLLVLAVGFVAGTINAIVGSGSLITFPTLLALGYPALLANVSNSIGLVGGGISATVAYRGEVKGKRDILIRLGVVATIGGVVGAVLLLALPATDFRSIVPVLILASCVLVVAQPRLARWVASRSDAHPHGGALHFIAIFLTAVYGGYFGATQGVIVIAVLAIFVSGHLQSINGMKNVLIVCQNGSAALLFICFTHVAWEPAGLLAVSSVAGSQLGGRLGRRIPPNVLRAVIVVVGLVAAGVLLAKQ